MQHNNARRVTAPWLIGTNAIALAVMLMAGPVSAQTSAQVTGTVTLAPDGRPAQGATVSVVSTNRQAVTSADGRFVLTGLPAGRHTLVATFLGQTSEAVAFEVAAGGSTTVDLLLDQALPVDGIVVSASRNVKIVRDVPAAVSVVTPNEIARRAPTVQGEELAGLSNVAVRDNSEGFFTSVRIRGVPNSHQNNVILALVDGVPFVTGGDEVDFERLVPAPLVERVEVVKGPASALYGRGGVAGSINYVTRPAFGESRVEGSLQGGSFGHVRPSLTLSLPLSESNQLLVSGFYEQKDGWVRGNRRQSTNVFVKDEWALGRDTRLTLYGNAYSNEQGAANHVPFDDDLDPVVALDERTNYQIPDAGDDRRVVFGSARLEHLLSPGLSTSLVVHARRHEVVTDVGFSDSFSTDQNAFFWNGFGSNEEDETWFVEPQVEWDGGRVRLTAGGSYEGKSGTEFNVWTGENGFPTPDFEFLFYVQKISAEDGSLLNGDRLAADTLSDYSYDGSVAAGYAQLTSRCRIRSTTDRPRRLGARGHRPPPKGS
jgi:outer membrane receptor protein involved in Fe transport